jgi:hypothetical protein
MVGWSNTAGGLSRDADIKNERECELYRSTRAEGIQPDGTLTGKINFARDMSDRFGARYGTDFRVVPAANRRGYDAVFHKDVEAATKSLLPGDGEAIISAAKKLPGSGVI